MPITVRVVSQEEYDAWVVEQGGTLTEDGAAGVRPAPRRADGSSLAARGRAGAGRCLRGLLSGPSPSYLSPA
jgi:hypothetical protein